MRDTKVAYRYAKSILGLASERNEGDRIEADFALMSRVLNESRDLRVFLKSPVVKADKKQKVLNAVFGNHISELMMAFVRILTSKGREYLLLDIAQSYLDQTRVRKGIMTATIESAGTLDQESLKEVHQLVTKFNHSGEIVLTEVIKPELIGGFILKVEGKMIDASVAGHLTKLRRQITKNLYEAQL